MKKWFNENRLILIGAVLGALTGWLYWKNIGCASGTCSITSKPINSSMYFGLIGAMVFSLFKKENKKHANKS